MQRQNIAVFSYGLLIGCFLSSSVFMIISPSLFDNACNQCGPNNCNIISSPTAILRYEDWINHGKNNEINSIDDHRQEGWKQIHVFYGNASHISDASAIPAPYFNANQWFSQYRQDEIISGLLHGKRNGYFVDLAANDAVRISNTYAIETNLDWDGICLEPNSAYWNGLSYRKCHVVAAVVGGNKPMEEVVFKFPRSKGPKGGIVGNEFDNKQETNKNNNQFELWRRFTIPLLDVLRKFNAPKIIDYMSLDVEGAEDLVMSTFPFHEYRFNLLSAERPSTRLSNILGSNGYILLKTLKKGKETLWVHISAKESLNLSALNIDSQNYKYRENGNSTRIAPEEQQILTEKREQNKVA